MNNYWMRIRMIWRILQILDGVIHRSRRFLDNFPGYERMFFRVKANDILRVVFLSIRATFLSQKLGYRVLGLRAPRYRALRCQNSWAATWVSLRNVNRPIIVLLFTIDVNCKIMTKLSPIFQISRLVLTFYEELAGIIKPSKTEKYFERIIMLVYITWTFLNRFWSFVVEVPRRLQKVPAQRKNLYQRKSELLRLVSFWYSCSE